MSRKTREIVARQKRRYALWEIRRGFIAGLTAGAIAYAVGCGIGTITANAAEEIEVPENVERYAKCIGRVYGICPELLEAIAFRESSFNADAENAGCVGLMQISEKWHEERMEYLEVDDLTDAYANMLVAADYLNELFEKYEDAGMVLMVYNGDYDAFDYANGRAPLSDYADEILTLSAELERKHGK